MFLRINPLAGGNTSKDISSNIKGRLVAVPPGEGLPVPILTISSERETTLRHRIRITAQNSAGEILVGQSIEININLEASRQLSTLAGVSLTSVRAGTKLTDVILITDETGVAETLFNIDSRLPAEAVLVLTAELGTETSSLTVPARGGA